MTSRSRRSLTDRSRGEALLHVRTEAQLSCQNTLEGHDHQQWPGWESTKMVFLLVACCLLGQSTAAVPVKEVRRILIFNEYGFSSPAVSLIDEEIRAGLEKSPYQIQLYAEYFETTLFPDEASQREFRNWYIHKYRDRKPDLIITVGPSPLKFMVEAHEQFFPDVPIVFCGSAAEFVDNLKLDSQFTGVWETFNIAKTLEVALELQPNTKRVIVVGGVSSYDRYVEAMVREGLRNYEGRLVFTYLTDLDMPTLLVRLQHLADHTIIVYTSIAQDAAGTRFVDRVQALPMVAHVANAPIFVLSDQDVAEGTIGGYVHSFAAEGRVAVGIARRILEGSRTQDISAVRGTPVYMFDWLAMQRWGFKDSALPAGSIVQHRQLTLWQTYRRYLIGGIALCLTEAVLIFGLLWQRARRRKAELVVRESEERFRLVANTAPVLIWMSGSNKLCTYFNKPWLDFTGRSAETELGNGWTEAVHADDLQKCQGAYVQAFDRRESYSVEYRLRRRDGEYRWIVSIGIPRFNTDGSFAGYIGSAIDVTERKAAEEALTSVSRRLIEAQEKERTRIARELHDDINQRIALVSIQLQGIQQHLPDAALDDRAGIHEVTKRMLDIGKGVQQISHRLHSSHLEYLGIVGAAKGFCNELSQQQKVTIEFTHSGVPSVIPQEIALCLFRVLQEGLHNAVKYSGTNRFQAQLCGVSNEILLTVRDSGMGFDLEEVKNGRGLGLISMQERVNLVNGTILIMSEPMKGTEIAVRVPLHMAINTSTMQSASEPRRIVNETTEDRAS
jgi:PAS domain S-box-containing protein